MSEEVGEEELELHRVPSAIEQHSRAITAELEPAPRALVGLAPSACSSFWMVDLWRGVQMAGTLDTELRHRRLMDRMLRLDQDDDGMVSRAEYQLKTPTSDPDTPMSAGLEFRRSNSSGVEMAPAEPEIEDSVLISAQSIEAVISDNHDELTSAPITGSGLLVLLLVGGLAASTALVVEVAIRGLSEGRALMDVAPGRLASEYVTHVLTAVLLAGLAALLVDVGAREAGGSGIPQMIAILDGIWMSRFLTLRTMLVKASGLILASASGLMIGCEGPFVHMAAIIATQVTQCSWYDWLQEKQPGLLRCCGWLRWVQQHFRPLFDDGLVRLQFVSAACACGVAATFGAPFSGVLFSIEVHHQRVYHVHALTMAFANGLCSAIAVHYMPSLFPSGNALFTTSFQVKPIATVNLVLFVLCGDPRGPAAC